LSRVEPASIAIDRRWGRLERPRVIFGLAGVYAASRLLGLVREMGVAFFFGTSGAADRFGAAFVVAGLASIVVGEALYAGSVRWLGGENAERSAVFTEARYANLLAVGRRAALAATGAFALVGPLATLIVLGHLDDPGTTIALSLALAPSVGASLFVACINARLTLERRYALLNGVPCLYSAGALVGLGVIALTGAEAEPLFVALGWSVGNVAAALVLYIQARPTPAKGSRLSTSALELFRVGLPLAVAFSLVAVQGLTDRAVAARLGTGGVAALSYADRLFLLPIGFVVAALGPMVLGSLVVERQREQRFGTVAREQLRTVAVAVVPLGLVFAAIAPGLVSLVFDYGKFDTRSLELTVAALDGFAVGIATVALNLVLFRMLQAVSQLQDVVAVSLVAVVLNAISSIAGGLVIGLYGVTLSTSFVAAVLVALQVQRLARSLGDDWASDARRHAAVPAIASSALAVIVVTAEHRDLIGQLGRGLVLVALAALSAAYLMRVQREDA
jgi:putative peptidoglycan lipid II flippase